MISSRLFKTFGVGVALTLGAVLLLGADEKPSDAPKGPTAAEKFKNIKVLQDLPADQLMPVMQNWSQSLGVRCGFCHDMADFSLDTKPEKGAAREMVSMVHRLNDKEPVVDKKVTCFMCHHGSPGPARSAEEAQKRADVEAAKKKAEENKSGEPEKKDP